MIPTLDRIIELEQVSFSQARAIRNNMEVLIGALGGRIYLMTPDEVITEIRLFWKFKMDFNPRPGSEDIAVEFVKLAVKILQSEASL